MSDSSGEELDRILQPNKEKLPSLPRHDPPDDLSDDEEFAEKLRQIKETYQNKPLPTVTKQTPIVRRLDDHRDDYGGHSDEEDEQWSRARESEASSRRDVFSTSTSNSKNTFDMSRARLSDVFPRRMENQSRSDDSDKDSDDESSEEGLLERVVPERRQEMRRVAVGNSRESSSRNSRRFEFDTRIRARPSQRPSESSRPRDTSRSRSKHQEKTSSSPSRRNPTNFNHEAALDARIKAAKADRDAAPRRPLPKDPRSKRIQEDPAPSDHEDLDNELDAEISGLVGQNSVVERSLSPGKKFSIMVMDKIGRRMAEQKRWREAAPPPPNDFDEPMIDDDDLPSRLRVLKEPKSSRPRPSDPSWITGDWDEPPTSSEAASKQGVKRPTMTDFFKPSPRPGRVPDQPPHRDLEGFKKTAVEWLNAKAVPAVKSAQGAGESAAGPKQLQRSDQAAPKPLQTPGTSRRAPEQAATKPLQTPGSQGKLAGHPPSKQLQRPEHRAPKPLQTPGTSGRAPEQAAPKQLLRPEQAAPRHRDPQRPERAAPMPLQTPGTSRRAPEQAAPRQLHRSEHRAPKPLQTPGTYGRAPEQATAKPLQTPGGLGRLAGHTPSSKQLLRPEQAAPRHRDPQRPDQTAPKPLRAPGTSGRAPEQAALKQLHRPEHRAHKPLQTPGTSGRRPEQAAPKHPHRQAAPRHRTPSPALLEPKIEVFSDDDNDHFSDLDHHAPRTPHDPNKTAKSLAKMDAVNKKHKANLDAKLEAKRREYELMEAELEKKRAVLEEYARREEQEKRRRQAEEAERRRPKSPVRVQKFICHTCGRHFISQKKLDDHKHSHTDNVQAICPMCNTEIKFKYNLRQHMTKCQERLKEKMGNQGIAEYYPEFAKSVKIAAEDPCLDLPPLPKGFVMLENGLVVGHDPMLDVNTSLLLKSFREEGAAMARKDKSKKNTMRRQKRDAPQDITLSDDDDDNDDDQPEPNGRGRGTRGRGGRGAGGGARGSGRGAARGARGAGRGGARANRHMEESEPDSFDDSDY
ncbi:unnamed protein product [Caenorhabditis brenneri]